MDRPVWGYRYLNCGYFVPAVGGTDKMTAATAVGAVRTYARIPEEVQFDYESWKAAVRTGDTFVTYGPLIEFSAEGRRPGSRLRLGSNGGTIDVEWSVASVTVPMTKVELVVNGEIRFSSTIDAGSGQGRWSVPVARSSWLALLVRGRFPDKPEMIAAHSSAVAVEVEGTQFFAAADAITILDQIECSLAYFDTLATRAETDAYRRMRLILTGAHREVHNRLHSQGIMHGHTPATRHGGHETR